ncbi:MAG: HAD-IA family hydrolase [Pseudonocardiaceae bacterium]|nr:HAD-IA family hydrolase [Pseudonocardiaceae bacterium]
MRDIVTFDCYRTLVDFNLESATHRILGDQIAEVDVDEEQFNHDARVMRFQGIVDEYRPYREVLRRALRSVMLLHGLEYRDEDGAALIAAIADFQPFPEVPDALRKLRDGGYQLAIISNSEDDLIQYSVDNIGVEFDYVVTAEQAGAYKPLPQAFEHLMSVIGRGPDRIVHAAQGWDYDIIPTKRYPGMHRVWVNRYGQKGSESYQPYDEISDLSALPPLLGL